MRDPFAVLGVSDLATAEEVKRAYRERARVLHPDVGGDADAFREVSEAYALALEMISARACADCGGSGSIRLVRGFSSLVQVCPTCRGSGRPF